MNINIKLHNGFLINRNKYRRHSSIPFIHYLLHFAFLLVFLVVLEFQALLNLLIEPDIAIVIHVHLVTLFRFLLDIKVDFEAPSWKILEFFPIHFDECSLAGICSLKDTYANPFDWPVCQFLDILIS